MPTLPLPMIRRYRGIVADPAEPLQYPEEQVFEQDQAEDVQDKEDPQQEPADMLDAEDEHDLGQHAGEAGLEKAGGKEGKGVLPEGGRRPETR
ncbi:hypothetical protein [Desulfobacter postgatei]|uniref:hypothetical protein n=1 Tax=Desulfobacter postgatei TaxID=2293 RepID=UPI0012F8F4A5|nr:hypothetical protein [Desulfobacter postgatei]